MFDQPRNTITIEDVKQVVKECKNVQVSITTESRIFVIMDDKDSVLELLDMLKDAVEEK